MILQHSPCLLAPCMDDLHAEMSVHTLVFTHSFSALRATNEPLKSSEEKESYFDSMIFSLMGMGWPCAGPRIKLGHHFSWQRRVIKRNCWNKRDVWTATTALMAIIQLHPWRMFNKCEHVLSLSIIFFFHSKCVRKRTHNIIKCVRFVASLSGLLILLCT